MTAVYELKPLHELCEFQRGLTYAKSDEVASSNTVVLRACNVDLATSALDLSDLRYISDEVNVPVDKRVRCGSLLICTASGSKSHLGKVAYIDNDYGFAFGGFMGQITPLAGVDGRFLYYALTTPAYKDFIARLSDGANINNLKFSDLRHFEVALPELAEQLRVVAILDEAFEGIATAKAHAEQNLRNASELFAQMTASLLAGAMSGAVCCPLEDLVTADCSLSYGIVQPGDEFPDGLPVVRPVDLNVGVVRQEGLKRIDPVAAKSYERTTLQGRDILLCVRGTTGTLAVADAELAGANVTRGIVPIRFNPARLSQDLGYWLMRSEPVQQQIRAKTYGTALMQINIRDLRQLQLPVPPLEHQSRMVREFVELESATSLMVSVYQRKLLALDELKQALLHQAFTGQL